jgi:phi LC3 family holin
MNENITETLAATASFATDSVEAAASTTEETPNAVTILKSAADAAEAIAADVKAAGSTTISRLKSWPMWVGILGAVWMFLSALGIPAKIGLSSDTYNSAIGAAGAVLVALGVVNNPTTAGLSTKE